MSGNDATSCNAPVLVAETMRKRGSSDQAGMKQAVDEATEEHIENVIQQLPSWQVWDQVDNHRPYGSC
jgi:hypothetical protein